MLGTLMRAGEVLDLFTIEEPEWGVTAAAQRLGIGKSLAHEALATLTEIGLLQRVAHGRYRLGWRTMSLASVLIRSSGLSACARPVLIDLARDRSRAVSLVAWERGRMIYLNQHQPRDAAGGSGPLAGTTVPADDSPPALVLLANRTLAEVAGLWSRGWLQSGRGTLEALLADLAEVRRVGWAVSESDRGGPVAVAAPIRDPAGDVAAAICLAAPCPCGEPAVRRQANLAVAAAGRISEALRGRAAAA